MGQISHTQTTGHSGVIYGGVAGKLCGVPRKSLSELLEEDGGRRDVLFLSIDLKLDPSATLVLRSRSRFPPRSSEEFVDLSLE